ncbi:GNAT family N-acetyltransferase [Paracoccus sp. ME4]|uniref:GNAT family N-acetyltransferase n=1 Tax=Paracoccus sp. ME4 TaxID=3138066 RepID=UPI00398AA96D
MIALERIGRDARARMAHIRVAPEQEPFCGSIASHFDADEPSCDFHAVLSEGVPVGFFKIDRAYANRLPEARADEIGLRGMMIDRTAQGRGTGKAAIAALRAHLRRHYPDAAACVLTVNQANPAARAVYLAGGFVDTGALYHGGRIGPQHILRLTLR